MQTDGLPQGWMLRAYAIIASALFLLLLPLALARIGTRRVAPLQLRVIPNGNGTLTAVFPLVAPGTIRRVTINGGLALTAASVSFLRNAQSLPAGTRIRYEGTYADAAPLDVSGTVRDRTAPVAVMINRLIAIAVGASFAICGLGIALAAADRRAQLAAAALSGTGLLFGPLLLEATTSAIHSGAARSLLLIAWQTFPRALGLPILAAFAAGFPQPLPRRIPFRLLLVVAVALAIGLTLAESLCQIPGVVDSLPLRSQLRVILLSRFLQLSCFALSLVATLIAIRRQFRARASLAIADRRRLTFVWNAVLAGLAIPLLFGIGQLAFVLILHKTVIPSTLMLSLFATTLVVPPAITYAARARRVDSVGLLVRRAVLFAFTRQTIQIVSFIPAAVLALLVWRHRNEPLVSMIATHPFAFPALLIIAMAMLRFAASIHSSVETLFFRERADARKALGTLVEAIKRVDRIDELSLLLEGEIDRALHLESIALFVRDRAGSRFRARAVPWFLEPFSIVAESLSNVGDFLDVDLMDRRSPLAQVGEIERMWLDEARVRMMMPIRDAAGNLLGFLALGEKRNELAFDREDRMLLQAIVTAAGLAIENQHLRATPPSGTSLIDTNESDPTQTPARYCPSCRRISDDAVPLCATDSSSLITAEIPSVIVGKYRLESYLGAGGMGVVYRARDLSLGRTVAIKTLPRVSGEAAARFQREARLGAAISHSSLAMIFAAESWRGRPLLIMEYLGRGTLAAQIQERPMAIEELIACAIKIGSALAALHDAGVLHRDVKPSNVGYALDGEPKLLDFGLARLFADSTLISAANTAKSTEISSETSGIIGTPAYLPPEAIVGRGAGPGVDLWGLSMSLYEGLTGRHPFREANPTRLMNRIVSEDIPDPRTVRTDCPPEIASLIATCLARDATRRPPNARAFVQAFREIARQ
jgi:hypothetical protein